MIKRAILIIGVVAIITAACGKSEESADATSQESMLDKAKNAASAVKDSAVEMASDNKDTLTEKTKSAAEEASAFVEKGSSTVVATAGEVKEVVAEKVEAVKEAVQDKAADLMSKSSSTESLSSNEQLSALTSKTGEQVIEVPAAAKITPAKEANLELGKSVYTGKCFACHSSGAAGAPKLDDGSWSARKAQGMDVMVGHAIKGFQGAKGYMPAKGGYAALTDEEVIAAVAYMASNSE